VRQAAFRGRINRSGEAEYAVDDETDKRLAGSGRAQLQHVVGDHERLAKIHEEVVDGLADDARREEFVDLGGRPDDCAVQRLLDGKARAVGALPRIAGGRSPGGTCRGAWRGRHGRRKTGRRQRNADGKDDWSHAELLVRPA